MNLEKTDVLMTPIIDLVWEVDGSNSTDISPRLVDSCMEASCRGGPTLPTAACLHISVVCGCWS